jgi:hypothetical protein
MKNIKNNMTKEQYYVCSILRNKDEDYTIVYTGHHTTLDEATMAARKGSGSWRPIEYTIEGMGGLEESWGLDHGRWIMT